jgi:pimeloyl-ACP methyl ester carboxylesterase
LRQLKIVFFILPQNHKMPVAAEIYYNLSSLGRPGSLPLILIHGAGGSHLGWHNRVRHLPGLNVYALDLPGHGKSEGTGRQSITAYARDVVNFMQTTGIYQAVVAGHSMGGMIAQQIALDYSDRVTGLILVCSAMDCPIPDDIVQGLLNPLVFVQSMNWLVDRLVGAGGEKRWAEATRQAVEQTRHGVLYGDLLACRSSELMDRVQEINVPTLVCYGDQDRFFSPKSSILLAQQLPGAKLNVFPGAGHLLPLERPDELADAMIAFMD